MSTPYPTMHALSDFADAAAQIVGALDRADFFKVLGENLQQLFNLDNFIVFYFEQDCAAQLVHTNLDADELLRQMSPYVSGLYLLDPFFIQSNSIQTTELLNLDEIEPEGFRESEFYKSYYKFIDIVAELRFVIKMDDGRWLHIFMEREAGKGTYSLDELSRLKSLEKFIDSVVSRHWAWRRIGESLMQSEKTPLGFGLRSVIGQIRGKTLTNREIDIVELIIKGHSSKSIADLLKISTGTVTNHKRNIHNKLKIQSQAQLFHYLLQDLFALGVKPR